MAASWLPIFVNKVILEPSQAPSFKCCLWLLLHHSGSWMVSTKTIWSADWKHLLSGPLQKEFADPCSPLPPQQVFWSADIMNQKFQRWFSICWGNEDEDIDRVRKWAYQYLRRAPKCWSIFLIHSHSKKLLMLCCVSISRLKVGHKKKSFSVVLFLF